MKMKKFLLVAISIFTIQVSLAQTAADYYLPLCVGNYLEFHTPDGSGGGWEARTTFNSIVQTDSINGEIYYLQKGFELMDFNPSDTLVFHYFWLRKDTTGDILLGAYDLTGNGLLDSAIIVPSGSVFFSNQYLTLGFSQTQSSGSASYTDSIISISATVGIYTNCIQKRRTRKINGVVDAMEDTYYAYNVGEVKEERFVPTAQVHVNNLTDFVATNCYLTGILNPFENENFFKIYPNPASDMITLNLVDNRHNINAVLSIYTLTGQLVRTELVQTQQQINLENLCNGVYIVEISSEHSSAKQKLVIQKNTIQSLRAKGNVINNHPKVNNNQAIKQTSK
jgi:hypothetical protein